MNVASFKPNIILTAAEGVFLLSWGSVRKKKIEKENNTLLLYILKKKDPPLRKYATDAIISLAGIATRI